MDTLRFNLPRLKRPAVCDELELKESSYIVFTLNRRALIENEENLREMLLGIEKAAGGMPVVAPLRGKVYAAVEKICSDANLSAIQLLPPLSYLEFGYLTAHACGIITDSGNVAEEATFNGVPCITLNSYTEHIETVRQGTNVLVGEDPEKLEHAVSDMVSGNWKKGSLPDRWDGRSAERIVQTLLSLKNT